LGSLDTYRADAENLALRWYSAFRKGYAAGDTADSLLKIAAGLGYPASNLRLAIDAEWREGNIAKALNYTNAVLGLENLTQTLREETERRKERLLKKLKK
jgi:hypothetical protein